MDLEKQTTFTMGRTLRITEQKQRIIDMLPEIDIRPEQCYQGPRQAITGYHIAKTLGVSQDKIRNDMRALLRAGRIMFYKEPYRDSWYWKLPKAKE